MNRRAIIITLMAVIALSAIILPICAQGPVAVAQAKPTPTPPPTYVISLKDGQFANAISFQRSGAELSATVEVSGSMVPKMYEVANIAHIDFPEPAQLDACTKLVADGKGADALRQIEPSLIYYSSFKDIPGSWWDALVRVKLRALQSLHRDAEVNALIGEMAQAAPPNSEQALRVKVLQASMLTQANPPHPEKALPIFEDVIKASKDPETLAYAWFYKADALYAQGENKQKYEDAVFAYLHLPVFYPDVKLLAPGVLVNTGRCFVHLEHWTDAQKAFNDVIAQYPDSEEAATAKSELKRVIAALPSPTPSPSPAASGSAAPAADASPAASPASAASPAASPATN
ncbi:MAG TPA: tetratricopeptide repeat protein [Chthoniobacteraceae bacterium]|nr:tetratricopeptide repeat protein [Chthoniobacteraceae bacterium]